MHYSSIGFQNKIPLWHVQIPKLGIQIRLGYVAGVRISHVNTGNRKGDTNAKKETNTTISVEARIQKSKGAWGN